MMIAWPWAYYEWNKVVFRMNRRRTKLQYFRLGINSKPQWRDIENIFDLVWALTRENIRDLDRRDRGTINYFMTSYLKWMKFRGSFPPFYYPDEVIELGADNVEALGILESKT